MDHKISCYGCLLRGVIRIKKRIEKIKKVIPIVLLVSDCTLELVVSSGCVCKTAPNGRAQRCNSALISLTLGLLLLV